jgi:hypothetical protein
MEPDLEKSIAIICPVRGLTKQEDEFLQSYVAALEAMKCKVHYPPRDTDQNDPIGLAICTQNKGGIKNAKEVHVYWNSASEGSKFDFGMSFMADKPVVLINRDAVQPTPHKSFQNVLLALDAKYRPHATIPEHLYRTPA